MDMSFAPDRDEPEKNLYGFSTIKPETKEEERLEEKLREFRERGMRLTCVVKVAILYIGFWTVQINPFDLV
jgi:hypothetical protein